MPIQERPPVLGPSVQSTIDYLDQTVINYLARSHAGLAAEVIADRLVSLAEPGCGPSVRLGESREALDEDVSWTCRLGA